MSLERGEGEIERFISTEAALRAKYGGYPVALEDGAVSLPEYFEKVGDRGAAMFEPDTFRGKPVETLEAERPGQQLELSENVDPFDGVKRVVPRFVIRGNGLSSEQSMVEAAEAIVRESRNPTNAVAQAEQIIYSRGEDL